MLDIKQYFFDSIEPTGTDPGDVRDYPADEFVNGAIRSLVTDGVYNGGEQCKIVPTAYPYTVAMLPGRAFIKGYYMDAVPKFGDGEERQLLQLMRPTSTFRADRIVIRLNREMTLEGRTIRPTVVEGTEGSSEPPPLTRTNTVYDLSLAVVLVRQAESVIPARDIADTRFDAVACGVAGFAPKPDLGDLIAQYAKRWGEEYAQAVSEATQGVVSALAVSAKPPAGQPGWKSAQTYLDGLRAQANAVADAAAKAQATAEGKSAPSYTLRRTLTAAGWTGSDKPYAQQVALPGTALTDLVDLRLDGPLTLLQYRAAASAQLHQGTQAAGRAQVLCYGTKPAVDLPLVAVVSPANAPSSRVLAAREYDSAAEFPAVGESGAIYLDKGANKLYRWDGAARAYAVVGSDYGQITTIQGGAGQ